jgi:hypothetical protein
MAVSSMSRRLAAGGNGSPNAACSRSHQPVPIPQNARPPAQRIEGGRGLGEHSRRPEGGRRHQRAEPHSGVQPGQQAQRHPRLRNRLPGPAYLRDLDQVIHQRDPAEPCLGSRARHRFQPRRRVVAPREPGDLEDEAHQDWLPPLVAACLPGTRSVRGLGLGGARPEHHVPALIGNLRGRRRHPAQLGIEDRRGYRQIPAAIALTAERRIGIAQHGDGRETGSPGELQVTTPAVRIQAERVHHGSQAAARPGRDDLVE